MRRLLVPWCLWLLSLALPGCKTYTVLTGEQRLQLQSDLTTDPGAERYLRSTSFITPFFGDASKRLLTPYPPEEVRLLNDLQGDPINPGTVEALVPAGTRVRVLKVEFPTAWVVAERILYSPRNMTWVYVDVDGAPPGPPVVVVLPSPHKTEAELRAELERVLVEHDMAPRIARFQERYRDAIRRGQVIEFMPSGAVELSWGLPEVIQRNREGDLVREEWVYPGERRRVFITQDQVTRTEVKVDTPPPRR